MAFQIEARPEHEDAAEFLLCPWPGQTLGAPEIHQVELMGRTIQLKRRHETGDFSIGPIGFRTDGTLKIGGKVRAITEIPEEGAVVGDHEILRSGADLIAVRTPERVVCAAYAHGCWYGKTMTKK